MIGSWEEDSWPKGWTFLPHSRDFFRLSDGLSRWLIGKGLPWSADGKESACDVGDPGSIPQSGRSPGEGNGNPLRCSCLENPRDGGAQWATVPGVTVGYDGVTVTVLIKESACQCRRRRFDPWVEKIPLRRSWQPTPVFLPGESRGQRIHACYSAWGCRVGQD